MTRNRTKADIISDLLGTLEDRGGSVRPTPLMYASNLSHGQMKKYLEEMVAKGWIINTKGMIQLTPAGQRLLVKLREMRNFELAMGIRDE